jgi:hypothetical protein
MEGFVVPLNQDAINLNEVIYSIIGFVYPQFVF